MLNNTTLTRLYNTLGRTPDDEMLKRVVKKQMRRNELLNESSILDYSRTSYTPITFTSRQMSNSSTTSSNTIMCDQIRGDKSRLFEVIQRIPNDDIKKIFNLAYKNDFLHFKKDKKKDIEHEIHYLVSEHLLQILESPDKVEKVEKLLNKLKLSDDKKPMNKIHRYVRNRVIIRIAREHNIFIKSWLMSDFLDELRGKMITTINVWKNVIDFQTYKEALIEYWEGNVLILPHDSTDISILWRDGIPLQLFREIVKSGFLIKSVAMIPPFGIFLSNNNGRFQFKSDTAFLDGFMEENDYNNLKSNINKHNEMNNKAIFIRGQRFTNEGIGRIHSENNLDTINWDRYKMLNKKIYNDDKYKGFYSEFTYGIQNSNNYCMGNKWANGSLFIDIKELNEPLVLDKNDEALSFINNDKAYESFVERKIYEVNIRAIDFDYVDFYKDIYNLLN